MKRSAQAPFASSRRSARLASEPSNRPSSSSKSLLLSSGGVRERRIDRTQADAVLGALDQVTFEEVDPHAFATRTFRLVLATGLRVPDAAYVEVAGIRRATLVTADRRQLEAAEQRGIPAVALSDVPPW